MRKEKYEREVNSTKRKIGLILRIYITRYQMLLLYLQRLSRLSQGLNWIIEEIPGKSDLISCYIFIILSLSIFVSWFTTLSSNGSLLFIEFRLITRILQTSRMSCWVNCLLKYNLRDFQLWYPHERKVINQGKFEEKTENRKRIWKSQSDNSTHQILYLPLN